MYANCNILSDADSSPKAAVDMDRDVIEFELRMKIRELQEENNLLHDELERHEAAIDNLKVQCNNAKKQLERHVQKCQQLEKENDEQREELNKVILREKTMALTVQRCAKEKENLTKRMETMEIELQTISALEERIEKLNKEKADAVRQIHRLREEFDERENECKHLRAVAAELENTSVSLKKSYEHTINTLREQNRQLADENTELQSLSMFNQYSSENLSLSPSITDGNAHSTPYKCTTRVLLEESLYTELKASGFVLGCANDSCKLEEELREHDDTISAVLEQLERIIQICAATWGFSNDIPDLGPRDSKVRSTEALSRRMTVLLNMVTEVFTKRSARDASTQLRADAAETLTQFGIPCFRDLSRTQPRLKPETDLQSIVSRYVNDNVDDDSFSRVVRTYTSGQTRFNVVDPIVEELHDIIENTLVTLASHKERSPPRSSRYRLVHTLPSCPRPLRPSAGTSTRRTFGCPGPRAGSSNSVFARGDSLNGDAESAPLATCILRRPDGNRTREMSEVAGAPPQAAPQKLAVLKENGSRSSQAPEVSGASSNPSSPRRKISVYCRSFDLSAMRDPREEDQGPAVGSEASGSPRVKTDDDSSARTIDPGIDEGDRRAALCNYRCPRSDFSSDTTPTKSSGDSLPDDESSPCPRPPNRTVRLTPMRLKLPRRLETDSNGTPATPDRRAFPVADTVESDVSLLAPAADSGREKDVDDVSARSSATFIVDKRGTELREDPHSRARRAGGESQRLLSVEQQSVDSEMSSREDSSDSESEQPAAAPESAGDRCASEADNTTADEVSGPAARRAKTPPCGNVDVPNGGRNAKRNAKGQRLFTARRSFSEGENNGRSKCRCKQDVQSASLIPEEGQSRVFPSLTDIRLQESGIANLSDTELNSRENLSELELQKKYTAFSLCLCTDRITLPQRVAMSLRQRDQSEKNLLREMEKMQRDIQDLAPLCTDRESVERVERVRHRLDMVARCAHKVSCTAETLGAVQQERRVARAVLLADRYLRMLQSRCEKLTADVAETKRILTENNIVIEENSGETGDDLPRTRYRSGICANNRMMMAKRRASIATMSRPMGNTQDVTKDTVRQRNSVCGRMTLRRPSFSESPKWEAEKLSHNNSSSSISELRGIFEQTESRRSSREENNNMVRLSQSNSQGTISCSIVEKEEWTSAKQETRFEFPSVNDDDNPEYRPCARSLRFQLRNVSWRTMLWSIVIFFLGFFVNQTLSTMNSCCPVNSWSIEQILSRYVQIRNAAPHPM